jgi:hypothetical protein
MSANTTTLALSLAADYAAAQGDRAKADGSFLTVCLAWHEAYATGAWGSIATMTRDAGWGSNSRKTQGILMLGLMVAEHGMPDALTVSGVEEDADAAPSLLDVERAIAATLAHGGKGSADRVRETIEDAETWEDAARGLVKGKPSRKTGSTSTRKTVTPPPAPTVKPRGNAALIADAIADIARVDAATLTEAETLALATLVQSIAALGKAYTSRAA